MNKVILIGRLTKDADLRFGAESGKAVARFTIAINRPMKKDEVDFISCIAFGKTGEVIANYTQKGSQIAVEGSIRTGSYEKDGQKVYTTDVVASRVKLLSAKTQDNHTQENNSFNDMTEVYGDTPF